MHKGLVLCIKILPLMLDSIRVEGFYPQTITASALEQNRICPQIKLKSQYIKYV